MKELETELIREKERIKEMDIPPAEEMESRLWNALETRGRRHFPTGIVAAAVVFVLLFTYSFDAIAYYGKKFTGYDEVVSGSLKELNEEGRGQEINKSCTFGNGVEFTLDGLMFDDNELVIFYKLHTTGKKLEFGDFSTFFRLEGLNPMGYAQKSGHGVILNENTAMFTQTFSAPQFYEKWMSLSIGVLQNQQLEEHKIGFALDRSKAMKVTVKQQLDQTAVIGDYQIHFKSLSATAMGTVIEGSITSEVGGAMTAFIPDDPLKAMEAPFLNFDLVTDQGDETPFSMESRSTAGKEVSFRCSGDALPKEFSQLQLKNIRLETYRTAEASQTLSLKSWEVSLAEDAVVKQVVQEGDEIRLVMRSKGIPVLGLFEGGRQLEQLDPGQFDQAEEEAAPVERTFRFRGTGEDLRLEIKAVRYTKISKDVLTIYGEQKE